MKILLRFFLLLLYATAIQPVSAQNNDKEALNSQDRSTCKTHDECVLTRNHCGDPKGINKQYLEEYQKVIAQVSQVIFCANNFAPANWPAHPDEMTVRCINSECKPVPIFTTKDDAK